jgi:hypothetical protein
MADELKRFVIRTKEGEWVATIYAEKFDEKSGDFLIGGNLIGSLDKLNLFVSDSGGRPNWVIRPRAARA